MRYIIMLILLSAFSSAVVLNEKSELDFYGDTAILVSHIRPKFYRTAGQWLDIDPTLKDLGNGHEYRYYTDDMPQAFKFRARQDENDIFRIEKDGYHFVMTPQAIGYTNGTDEVRMDIRRNILADIDGNTINFPRFLHDDISLTFNVGENYVRKEIIILKNDNIPRAPERLLGENCTDWCDDCPVRMFVEYKLYIHDDLTMFIDGRAWGEASPVSTMDGIYLKDGDGHEIFTIAPSYMIGNYTGYGSYYPMRYDLDKVDDYILLRASAHYYDFIGNASYPLLIDPEIIISGGATEITWEASGEHFNMSCSALGNCCTFGLGGSCTTLTDLTPSCQSAFKGSTFLALKNLTHYCYPCGYPDFNCCRRFGTAKQMMLWQYNWSSQISIDYNQVLVNNATVEVAIGSPNGNVTMLHHDSEEGFSNIPYCLSSTGGRATVHDEDDFPQPPQQVSASYMYFNFTEHVQDEFYDNFDVFYVFLHDVKNTQPTRNIIDDSNLTINFSFDPSRPPFVGDWVMNCTEDITGNHNVTGDMIIESVGDMVTLDGNLSFISDDQRIIMRGGGCDFVLRSGSGLN